MVHVYCENGEIVMDTSGEIAKCISEAASAVLALIERVTDDPDEEKALLHNIFECMEATMNAVLREQEGVVVQ